MAATPPRTVRWDPNSLSPSFLHSPNLEASTESYISTSSLEYVNAQLVAHGFAPSPGLSLDGLSGTDSDRVVKCLLGMLSQRVEDMSRTEELSTKLRILTYDHERLLTMHRTATEKVTTAEKEVNLYKTKLTAAQRTLQTSESAHKQTTAELQRTRTALQGIRATHHLELKKKEKELERMADKWNKLSDTQTKLSTVPAGIKCANAAIVHGSELIPRTPSLLDTALDDAERAREQLIDEVGRLRRLVVKVVNQVQAVSFQVRGFMAVKDAEPPEYTVTSLFPMHPPTHAHDVLSATLRFLRDTLAALPQHIASAPAPAQTISPTSSTSTTTPKSTDSNVEVARLQATIARLKEEIDQAHTQAQQQAAQTQALFDNFVASQQKTSANIAEMSMELMTTPTADAERERLEKIRQELDNEREKFTQATVKLGKERTALEADKIILLEEKRSWEVQQMLADLPPTPDPHPHPQSDLQPPAQASHAQQKSHKPPRKPKATIHQSPSKKSPRKPRSHKRQSSTGLSSASRKATRVFRRPSVTPVISTTLPAYETEVIVTVDEVPQAPQQQQQHPSTSTLPPPPPPPLTAPLFSLKPPASTAGILPSTFVLPPPSPHASLPRQPLLPPSSSLQEQLQSIPQPDFLMTHLPPPTPIDESTPFPGMKTYPHPHTQAQTQVHDQQGGGTVTPIKRPFPVAKPFAQRIAHAYSPAKPSPLSRILMLNQSPDTLSSEEGSSSTIDARQLGIVREEGNEFDMAEETFPEVELPGFQLQGQGPLLETPQHQQGPEHRQMSLAAELGVESPPDVIELVAIDEEQEQEEPLKKKRKMENPGNGERVVPARGNGKPSTTGAGAKKPSAALNGAGVKERPKTRTTGSETTGVSRGGGSAGGEKENGGAASRRVGVRASSSTSATASSAARAVGTRATTRSAGTTKTKVPTGAGSKAGANTGAAGPRRVPINSAEAPAIRRNS